MIKLTTIINKPELATLCADAISELERAARLHPEWPDVLFPEHHESQLTRQLEAARQLNDSADRATAHSVFGEEYYEFLEAALKPGNIVAARAELVQAMAMLLRISCHLNDYVSHRGTEGTEPYHPNLDGPAEPVGLAMEVQP